MCTRREDYWIVRFVSLSKSNSFVYYKLTSMSVTNVLSLYYVSVIHLFFECLDFYSLPDTFTRVGVEADWGVLVSFGEKKN